MKIIVFDLDETLGHFGQIGDFIEILELFIKKTISRQTLYSILTLFPNVFRTDLFNILFFIKRQKRLKHINKVMIYTNNMAPRSWVLGIKTFIELTLKTKLFDRVISAYKVNGKQIEKKRTTHQKTYNDLINITNLSTKTKVLFFDDQSHSIMNHPNVHYVKVKPYTYIMNNEYMVRKFLNSNIGSIVKRKADFLQFAKNKLPLNEKSNTTIETHRWMKNITKFIEY